MEKLSADEVARVRELLEVAGELVEFGRWKRADAAAIRAANQLGADKLEPPREIVFRPPGVREGDQFGNVQGLTVLKEKGAWRETVEAISKTTLEGAERAYLGGRIHEITEAEARELSAAGYVPEWRIGRVYEPWQPTKDTTETKEERRAVHH